MESDAQTAFTINVIGTGGLKSLGIFLVEFRSTFDAPDGVISTLYSIISVGMCFLNPVSVALGERYGYRLVTMSGGLFLTLGALLSSFAPNIWTVIYVFGIFNGLGYCCTYTSGLVMVAKYFRRRRALASGLALTGTSVGDMVMPLFNRYLNDTYGLRGALVLYAGVVLQICVAGAIYRPASRDDDAAQLAVAAEDLATKTHTVGCEPGGITKKYGTVRESCRACFPCCNADIPDVKPFLNFTVFRNTQYIAMFVGTMAGMPAYICSYLFLPLYSADIGLSNQQVSSILAVTGALSLVGRILFGWFADFHWIKAHFLFAGCTCVCGTATILAPLFPSIYTVGAMMGIIGFFGGGYSTLMPISLIEVVGKDYMPDSLAMMVFAMGIFNIAEPPILGFARDATGGYQISYQLIGALLCFNGFMLYLTPLTQWIRGLYVERETAIHSYECGGVIDEEIDLKYGSCPK